MEKIYDKVSAGGLVYKIANGEVFFVICFKKTTNRWHLPKGTQELNENIKNTAIREVQEETGLKVSIKKFLSNIEYSFKSEINKIINKQVVFYTMTPNGGSFTDHDDEFDEVKWASVKKCINLLQYDNEKKLVQKAYEMVKCNE
jgi:8-oxo-dGTP pyrophosphatase MutT (NUDIX family)